MSVTAVPLRPIGKGALVKLWFGIAALLAVAGALAWHTTSPAALAVTSPEAFLAWNGSREGVTTTPSGLQYEVVEAGEGGAHPTAADVALIDYEGKLTDGEAFDSGEQTPMPLSQVLPGFAEAIQSMSRGARHRFWLPPGLAYGDAPPPQSPIPPGAVLEFDVTLHEFISEAQFMQLQMQMQQMQEGGGPAAAEQ